MLSRILIPLDGSPLAAAALPFGVALARSTGARLVLTRAVLSFSNLGQDADYVRGEALGLAAADLDAIADALIAEGVPVETRVVWGSAAETIVTLARELPADMIVMSTHGRGGVGRWLYGSVADDVLRHAAVPVLLIPSHADVLWSRPRRPRVLVPLDGSELSQEALGPATIVARALGGDLHLLQVIVPPAATLAAPGSIYPPYPTTYFAPEQALDAARVYLSQVAAGLPSSGVRVTYSASIGDPAATIADMARHQDFDLIAMATHGRSGIARLVLGSVATGTLQRTAVPMLVVRPLAVRTQTPAGTVVPGESAEPPAAVPLTAREIAVIRQALEMLVRSQPSDAARGDAAGALLARLRQGVPSGSDAGSPSATRETLTRA